MRILVTGGAGFIGSHTVDMLVAGGERDVAVLDNLSAGKREQINPAARFYEVDLRNAAAVKQAVEREKPETIIHLAAQMDVRKSVASPTFDAEVNLLGFLNLMESARQHGLKRVIFSSTGGAIYGEQEAFPCDEEHPCRPVSPYGVSKLATEAYLFFYRNEYKIDYVCLRYANVYGPRQDPHGEAGVVAIFCGRIIEGKPCTIYGDGKPTRDYISVDDVARANLAALRSQAAGAFNIGTGIETDVNKLHATLVSVSGEETPRPQFQPLRPGEQQRSVISPARAERELGWHPQVSLRDGLERTFRYFRERSARGG